ncbi:MAG: ChbG/HpnK family deacetylase [Burkholderiales bacterium]|nr:ChbG/HpnK family deacetylase [Burkholderiales bacterium]
MSDAREPAWLIVNADDYGYYGGVSRGILDAAAQGIVTATGVLANAARFDDDVPALRECSALDAGVHLNLTSGEPLAAPMRAALARWGGRFPGKFAIARAVATGAVPIAAVESEWRAQIERCLRAGLALRFLNSHEHVHMHPRLFGLAQRLCAAYGIEHLRFTAATPAPARTAAARGAGARLRGAIVGVLAAAARARLDRPVARFLGLECSGRLGRADLDAIAAGLQPGEVYELMCHPGRPAPGDVDDARLLGYHDWQGEFAALTAPGLRDRLAAAGVQLIGYRELEVAGGRLVVRAPGDAATTN